MLTIGKMTVVIGACAMLGGCGSPLLQKLGLAPRKAPSPQIELTGPAPQVAGAQSLAEGRALLRDGQVSAAVAAFRLARLDPATQAEANNGLGVAYAKLGRLDLADRYFRAAIDAAPGDMRFAANFLRLQRQVEIARADAAAARAAAARPAPRMAQATPVHRLSDGEMVIHTAPAAVAAPRMAIAYLDPPKPVAAPEAAAEASAAEAPVADAPAQPADMSKVITIPK